MPKQLSFENLLLSTYCVNKCTVESEEFDVYIGNNRSNYTVENQFVNTTAVGYVCIPTDKEILEQAGDLLLQAAAAHGRPAMLDPMLRRESERATTWSTTAFVVH